MTRYVVWPVEEYPDGAASFRWYPKLKGEPHVFHDEEAAYDCARTVFGKGDYECLLVVKITSAGNARVKCAVGMVPESELAGHIEGGNLIEECFEDVRHWAVRNKDNVFE